MRGAFALAALALTAAPAEARTTATANRTDDPTRIELRVKLDITVKRPLERKVFAEPCAPGNIIVCNGEVSRRVHLHRGHNGQTVTMAVARSVYDFVGTNVTGIPWDGYRMVAAPVGSVWVRFGHEQRAREVVPSPVAHDTLVDRGTQ